MKQATKRRENPTWPLHMSKRLKEGMLILLCSLAIYFLIALITYNASDPAWSHSGMSTQIHNAAGKTGAWFSDIMLSLFGYLAYIIPTTLILSGLFIYRDPSTQKSELPSMWLIRSFGLLAVVVASCGLASMHLKIGLPVLPMSNGGMLGAGIQNVFVSHLNSVGATIILLSLCLAGITFFTGLSWLQLLSLGSQRSLPILTLSQKLLKVVAQRGLNQAVKAKRKVVKVAKVAKEKVKMPEVDKLFPFHLPEEPSEEMPFEDPLEPLLDGPLFSDAASSSLHVEVKLFEEPLEIKKPTNPLKHQKPEKPVIKKLTKASKEGWLPSLSLLEEAEKKPKQGYSSSQLQELSRLVEMRLLEFGVEVKVVGILPGPVITRFELELAAGIKVSKITGLAKDLARSLSVISVRVVEVIPGKPVVGIEIPNVHRELVRLKTILEDPSYQSAISPLSLALGKDISGRPVTVDLAKMPHLLVAGTTGSGKSVGLNAMLLSILCKATPQEVRLILIDPKMLELAIYHEIPHLLTPVVTDMKDAANALRWSVAEMERRYQLMAAIGVRNLSGYNEKVGNALANGQPILDPFWLPQSHTPPEALEKLPFIVVVVDEFADMIMVVGKKVEELIARIAQKARAAGIHLILATQRPSVDVITGLIKANIPTRIAFQVSSRIDSRTILDQSGAEQLLGHGDMLYLPPGVGVPHRIHGAFVSDEEVHRIADEWRRAGEPTYIDGVTQSLSHSGGQAQNEEMDELYDEAVNIVTQARKASISLVQRRLKIGYNRAARLVEQMEAEGVVSEIQSNGQREVLAPPPVQ